MTSSLEVELKLELPLSALGKLRKLALIRELGASAKRTAQISIYFDTDKHKLRRHGVALRVRRIGARYIQTIKATHNSNILVRDECESEIAGGEPDLEQARRTALDRFLTRKFRRKLKPQFETRVRRTVFLIERGGAVIELALDVGTIETRTESMRLCEVELELKRGDKAHLFDVARLIARALPAQLALTSKSERGYLLCDGTQGMPAKFAPVTLTSDMPAREGFREIGRACLWQIVGNEPAVLKHDTEGIHQMRLGSSKLRTAISLFSAILPDPQTEKIETELEWLASELGSARELEALMARALMPVRRRRPGWDDTLKLSRQIAGRRAAALDRVRDAIASQRYRLLKIDIAAWLEAGAWAAPQDVLVRDCGELPIKIFAAGQLSARGRKIRKRAKSFAALGPRRRHKLRVLTKELHDATDFFATLFSGTRADKRRKKFLAALATVQACLGDLDGIAVDENAIGASGRPRRSAGKMFAAGALSGRKPGSAAALLTTTQEALDRFAKAKPFWG